MKEHKRNKEFDKRLIECIQKNYSFFAWQSVNGVIEKCELKGKALRTDYGEIELEAREGQAAQIKNVISGNRKISIYIPEMAMTFQTPLKNIVGENIIKIVIPEDYSIHERRKHERVEPEKKCFVSIEIKSQLQKKKIFDISLGGFAIILPKIEKLAIEKGAAFPKAFIEFEGNKGKIKAKVICTSSFGFDRFKYSNFPYGGYKMSFCFSEISVEDKKLLQEFIVSEIMNRNINKKAN
jgi:c-di-GMP-binding flagellar brake protein YcgR